jgi:hypothetical protein
MLLVTIPAGWWFSAVLALLFSAALILDSRYYCDVALEDGYLELSAFQKTDRVPLNSVLSVDEQRLRRSRWIVLRFDRDTAFGRSIHFVTPGLKGVGEDPMVATLRQLVRAAQSSPSASV